MADEKKAPGKKGSGEAGGEAAAGGKKSPPGKLGLFAGVMVAAALLAVATFIFVLKPMLAGGGGEGQGAGVEDRRGDPSSGKEGEGAQVRTVRFDQAVVTLLMPHSDQPASLLLFQMSMECANPETEALVTQHKAKLAAMLTELHSFRRREELNDPATKKAIEKAALQKANDILQQYLPKPNPKIKVQDIFHETFVIEDK